MVGFGMCCVEYLFWCFATNINWRVHLNEILMNVCIRTEKGATHLILWYRYIEKGRFVWFTRIGMIHLLATTLNMEIFQQRCDNIFFFAYVFETNPMTCDRSLDCKMLASRINSLRMIKFRPFFLKNIFQDNYRTYIVLNY